MTMKTNAKNTLPTVTTKEGIRLKLHFDRYYSGDIGVWLSIDGDQTDNNGNQYEDGERWSDLTVNLPGYMLPNDMSAWIPNTRHDYIQQLAEAGLLTVIGQARYGNYGQTASMVEFTDDAVINMPEADRD